MRGAIVEQICRGAASEAATRARAPVDGHGNIATQLVAAGFAPARVLEVCCAVTEIPACDIAWIRDRSSSSTASTERSAASSARHLSLA